MGNESEKAKKHAQNKTSEYKARSAVRQNQPSFYQPQPIVSNSNFHNNYVTNLIFPKNSEGIQLQEGTELGRGILYCGRQYSSYGQSKCGGCDGQCGPHNGCACPECENILSYMLYISGKMTCEKCKGILIRLPLRNLQELTKTYSAFFCDICRERFTDKWIPVLHCFSCDYDVCPPCALKMVENCYFENMPRNIPVFGKNRGEGLLYCGRKYTNRCLCGTCDGSKKINLNIYIIIIIIIFL